jgi:hypothetical protein
MWSLGDDYFGTSNMNYQDDNGNDSPRGDNEHPESGLYGSSLNADSDSAYEYAYISAALAVVDVDSDGDADTLYFPITTTYRPSSEGGSGYTDTTDPGSSWVYKACVDTENPGTFSWAEFYDPVDDGGLNYRPEVYYAATTAWHSDGQLGVYWGSGSPYDRESARRGYFFAVKDSNPLDCDSFTMTPITDCGATGLYELDIGEGLTSDPTAFAGVVYFSTWQPERDAQTPPQIDKCELGSAKLYGLRFDDCSSGLDTNGDGTADSDDDESIDVGDADGGYSSGVTITDAGTIIYASSSLSTDGSSDAMGVIDSATNPFLGTATIAWMEMF